jgi:hypothetical protein
LATANDHERLARLSRADGRQSKLPPVTFLQLKRNSVHALTHTVATVAVKAFKTEPVFASKSFDTLTGTPAVTYADSRNLFTVSRHKLKLALAYTLLVWLAAQTRTVVAVLIGRCGALKPTGLRLVMALHTKVEVVFHIFSFVLVTVVSWFNSHCLTIGYTLSVYLSNIIFNFFNHAKTQQNRYFGRLLAVTG